MRKSKLEGLKVELTIFENGLITVYESDTGEKLVIGRELYKGLQIKSKYSDWLKRRVEECAFEEGEDYIELFENVEREVGASKAKEHYLKLDAAKEVAMLERNGIGKTYRKYLISVEKKAKEQQADINNLSPELKLLINLEMSQKKMKEEIKETKKQSEDIKEELKEIKEVIVINPKEQWRTETNRIIGKICKAMNNYKTPRERIYKALDERAKCNLNLRLENLKGRALKNGMSRSKVDKLNYLDVINNDHKLKEIYVGIVKEFAIKYRV